MIPEIYLNSPVMIYNSDDNINVVTNISVNIGAQLLPTDKEWLLKSRSFIGLRINIEPINLK